MRILSLSLLIPLSRLSILSSLSIRLLMLLAVLISAHSAYGAEGQQYARLRVDSDPPGADVVIVAELGKTPLVNEFIVPGMYKIELRRESGYLPAAEELTLRADQQATVSLRLKKPPLFTKRRQIQLAVGAGAIACFGYAVYEQGERSAFRQKHYSAKEASSAEGDEYSQKANEYLETSKDAELKRTLALIGAGILSVALQVTIFIW
ncbi:hypothetical protein R80B4_00146 [Fibrobacteres bacterium R8-0-B4]